MRPSWSPSPTNDPLIFAMVDRLIAFFFLDFVKAFEKVKYYSFLKKTVNYCINTNTLRWLQQFLVNRLQKVVIDIYLSVSDLVLSGISPGNSSCYLLFLINSNDLRKFVSLGTSVRLFSHDSAVYGLFRSLRINILQT